MRFEVCGVKHRRHTREDGYPLFLSLSTTLEFESVYGMRSLYETVYRKPQTVNRFPNRFTTLNSCLRGYDTNVGSWFANYL